MKLREEDKQELIVAKSLLENPGIAMKITNVVGTPIEKGLNSLPQKTKAKIGSVSNSALLKAAEAAIFTMKNKSEDKPSNIWHKAGVATTGAVGGLLGFAGMAVELPISTTIMLRSIAEIGRSQGESLNNMETKLACLEVFALGGKSKFDDGAETGYYMIRSILSKSLADGAEKIAAKGITEEATPILFKFIAKISERFGIQVTEKFVAQSVPVVGALGGALINTLFIDHFQDMAKGHFIVRKLERKYGKAKIEQLYHGLN